MNSIIKKYQFVVFIFLILTLSSCSKKILYMSDLNVNKTKTLVTHYVPYKLQPYDYLYISIKTSNKKLNQLFTSVIQSSNIRNGLNNQNSNLYYLSGYMVNDSGYIYLPIIGHFYVKGKTIEQVQQMIQNKVNTLVSDAIVKVRLLNFNVYFIGEVNKKLTFFENKVNILQAISYINGLPYSANKQKIYILRRQDSVYHVYTINLTTKNMFENKNFFLQPNDIVYIPPRPMQIIKQNYKDISLFVSLATTLISFVTLILTLRK